MAANLFQTFRQGFNRNPNKGNGSGKGTGSNLSSPTFGPSFGSAQSFQANSNLDAAAVEVNTEPSTPKFFFREKYAKLGVKGNFMPLAAQPKNVDLADWLAHQAVEQYRIIDNLNGCIMEVDTKTGLPLCNPKTCPVMSAGGTVYTWMNASKEPIRVPASQYIALVQRWIIGKLADNKVFPTDKLTGTAATYASGSLDTTRANTPITAPLTSLNGSLSSPAGVDWLGKSTGFPENFYSDCRTIFRQIFRIYAHIYHSHWLDPFWHIHNTSPPSSGWTDLNSCFVHYITVAKLFGLLSEKDMEPMQPLIDIWVANGSIPADAAAGACAISLPAVVQQSPSLS